MDQIPSSVNINHEVENIADFHSPIVDDREILIPNGFIKDDMDLHCTNGEVSSEDETLDNSEDSQDKNRWQLLSRIASIAIIQLFIDYFADIYFQTKHSNRVINVVLNTSENVLEKIATTLQGIIPSSIKYVMMKIDFYIVYVIDHTDCSLFWQKIWKQIPLLSPTENNNCNHVDSKTN